MKDRLVSTLVKKLEGNLGQVKPADYLMTREGVSDSLLTIFKSFRAYLPKKKKLKVISVASGVPDEFIALLAFYTSMGIVIDFTGVDINANLNVISNYSFSTYLSQFRLLTCDALDLESVQQALKTANALPEDGFDLVFLRHPDVLTADRLAYFFAMVSFTVPFLAAADATFFVSTYHEAELQMLKIMIMMMPNKTFSNTGDTYVLSGAPKMMMKNKVLELNKYSAIFKCEGSFFNRKMKNDLAKTFEQARQDSKQTHTQITFYEPATAYLERLSRVIGDEKLVSVDASPPQVRFSNFWLKQLAHPALDELATQMSTGECQELVIKK